ncbi:MAG: hypothetical protein U9R08_04625 [Nanoarchaeota archaeon]|nr:hypothetical protein [Nanoarchaeota archaeon]
MKKLIAILLFTLFLVPIVYAGVTNPLPPELELLKSESGRFKFQIQNLNKPQAIECIYELQGESDLNIDFDDDIMFVDANSKAEFYGTVKAPKILGFYTQEFCIRCSPASEQSGATVKIDSCGLPVNVNVVQQRLTNNMTIPDKSYDFTLIIALVLVAVFVVVLLYHFKKGKSKKPAKPLKKPTKSKKATKPLKAKKKRSKR